MADVEEEQKWSGKSHLEVVAEVRGAVRQLLQDPLLHDLPPDVTPEEAGSRLAVVQGRALTLQLRTYQDRIIRKLWKLSPFSAAKSRAFLLLIVCVCSAVVVLQGCTVRGLMQAVEREVSRDCSRRRGTAANLLSW